MQRLLEAAIEDLPDDCRSVLVLREVEEMDTNEAAAALDISEKSAKVRFHRARALLRKKMFARAGVHPKEVFLFHAVRGDRLVNNVFARIAQWPLS